MTDNLKLEVNAIIFDFDGVIVDSVDDLANAVNYTLDYFKWPTLPKGEITGYIGGGIESLIRKSFKECDNDIINQALPVFREYYMDNCIMETKLYDNVKETLHFFKDKKIALVTNKQEDMTRRMLDKLGIMSYFKVIIGPESVEKMKPDPEGIKQALRIFDEKPDKAIMVGDSYTDVLAGKNARTYTCGVTYGIGSTRQLVEASPYFVIDNIIRLTEILK